MPLMPLGPTCKLESPVINQLLFFCFFSFRYHCHTLPPVSPRAVGTVTRSKVLWTGTQVPSCQPTNCQVSGTLPTPTEGSTATTTRLHTHNKVCHHRVKHRPHLVAVFAENITALYFRLCCQFLFSEADTHFVRIGALCLACQRAYLAINV